MTLTVVQPERFDHLPVIFMLTFESEQTVVCGDMLDYIHKYMLIFLCLKLKLILNFFFFDAVVPISSGTA